MSPPKPDGAPFDIWRDSALRYAGYANEFGEAFRPLIPKSAVVGSYVVAIGYAAGDTVHKGKETYEQHGAKKAGQVAFNAALWQTLASVTVPAFFVNRQVALTRYALAQMGKTSKFGPTLSGLAIIPVMPYLLDPPITTLVDKTTELIFGKDA